MRLSGQLMGVRYSFHGKVPTTKSYTNGVRAFWGKSQ
jgi:hypothetical protein